MKERVLKFRLKARDFNNVWETFFPEGQTRLNSKEWRGKEPRSCGVVGLSGHGSGGTEESLVYITVAYRPKGYIYFVGDTKYDGWTAMMLDRTRDGTLLDGKGTPLPPGAPPVYLPFEIYKEADYNELDFGDFIEEVEGPGVERRSHDAVITQFQRQMSEGEGINSTINSDFMAPKRHRPHTMIILTTDPSGEGPGGFGDKVINININSPYLQQEVRDQIERLMTEFLEGRISLATTSNSKMVFVDLSGAIVDCSPNERGEESRFHILHEFVSTDYLEELAKRLMANYRITVAVVEGRHSGLLLTKEPPDQKRY
jgi:hypothetical protein